MALGVAQAIRSTELLLICPSNPFINITPILQVQGLRAVLARSTRPMVAVSPIVGGKALKGPAGRMLGEMGYPISAFGVAMTYQDLARVFLLDHQDQNLADAIEGLGMKVLITNTVMRDLESRKQLASRVVDLL